MRENEYQIFIQFANTIKSLLMNLWYPNQSPLFLEIKKWE